MNQVQIQEKSKTTTSTLDKARIIAASKRVRRSEANSNIWLVRSGNPKTPKKFYRVMFDAELDAFTCDCMAYAFTMPTPCKHVYACAIFEGSK